MGDTPKKIIRYMGEKIRNPKGARAVSCRKQYRAFIYGVYGVW